MGVGMIVADALNIVSRAGGAFGARWAHVVVGITWIGLLYYFNFVQVPAFAEMEAAARNNALDKLAWRALWWFRWGAVATWLGGAWLLGPTLLNTFTFGLVGGTSYKATVLGIGVWLGTIMLLNVWGIIWPNQKKILGIVPATDEEKAKARKTALYASRTNFILSIPMLLCMAATSHGLPI